MPETSSKIRPHPSKRRLEVGDACAPAVRYAELAVTSNFTFLEGASHPDELVAAAAELGCTAVAITDVNTLAGVVRAHVAARGTGIQLVVGCRLRFAEPGGLELLVYPTDLPSYSRLCRMLSMGKQRAEKGNCQLVLHDLLEAGEGLLAVVRPPEGLDEEFIGLLGGLRAALGDRLWLEVCCFYGGDDCGRLDRLAALSHYARVPLAATNDVHYHTPRRRALQDVLTCIRHGCTIAQAGSRLLPNAERHLKPPAEMVRLFAAHPRAIEATLEIAVRTAGFNMEQLRYQYPHEVCLPGLSPIEHLIRLAWAGAARRYPSGVSEKVAEKIRRELAMIDELGYAPYFLTVHDLVKFARGRGILCQGRGAAANSAVCFCLGVTCVDPSRIDVLFERFISRERGEPPDIDIDFEHERREEVIQYIYRKYGRHRAALTAEVISYRGRLAVREVGKALGFSQDCVDRLAKSQDWWDEQPVGAEQLAAVGLDGREPSVAALVRLTNELMGFPRHLSQHVGGFVITRDALCDLVPIEKAAMPDRTIIEWDKDDIDALGMIKVDCLALGMLTCIRKAMELVQRHHGRALTLAGIPPEDPLVYEMICRADTVGVFQIESRAQMSMLPRLRPRCFYDLVIEVAIVRPGPIVGDMVHPYLRRRQGIEPVEYPNERVREVLGKTLGVPLFQEQAMRLAIVAGGFTGDEADELRRAIASKRSARRLEQIGRRLIEGMITRGYAREFAEKCFKQFQGFAHYGFPESHAASFALLVYASAWLKRHYPAAFAAALLSSQPMGFYAPAQIVAAARRHGVAVLAVDVNFSGWDCRLEEQGQAAPRPRAGGGAPFAIRLGMRMVNGLRQAQAVAVERAVARHGRFDDVQSLRRAGGISTAALRKLAAADAFRSMGLTRQAALWEIRALSDEPMPLFDDRPPAGGQTEPPSEAGLLPSVGDFQKVMQDYESTGLSLRQHPMAFIRDGLRRRGVATTAEIRDARRHPHGARAGAAGVVLVRQRPGSAGGVIFLTIEDETGTANVMIRPSLAPRVKKTLGGSVLLCSGWVERAGKVAHLIATDVQDISHELRDLAARSRNFR